MNQQARILMIAGLVGVGAWVWIRRSGAAAATTGDTIGGGVGSSLTASSSSPSALTSLVNALTATGSPAPAPSYNLVPAEQAPAPSVQQAASVAAPAPAPYYGGNASGTMYKIGEWDTVDYGGIGTSSGA